MSKAANKTLIGAFILGAIALAVVAAVILGSGKFMNRSFINVMYFEGSVKGLNVGSPVMFRGVRIGSVKKIELRYDGKNLTFLIPVYIEIDPDKMVYVGHKPGTQHTKDLIAKGLRARLDIQSVVTGQLAVNLDLYHNPKPPILYDLDKRYDEIPTIPSALEEITKTVEGLPVQELFDRILSISKGLDRMINASGTQQTVKSMRGTIQELQITLHTVNEQIGPLMVNLRDTSESFRSASRNIDQAMAGDQGIPVRIRQTLGSAQAALMQVEKTLRSADSLMTEKAAAFDGVDTALDEVTNAARSLRYLTEYLERHPESIITGNRP